ncbi:hypothetical protein EB796_018988 [Bugula neritina]|uniref:Uncharacterized protein n=1 Tax=Bugula neritina TaxID=10212 RepID=A0A7J7J8Z9_BUGNE|nr:hypothetical protein EB796_018988 [Bugula neritina]
MNGAVVITERYGSSNRKRDYVSTGSDTLRVLEQENERFQSIGQMFETVFLPQGYPESVSSDYLRYQIYDTIQAFASSITGTLATQALLKGVGVGDDSATALAATITWIMKDGTGMIGRILFAWLQGSSLDCDAKRWRLFADMLNDFAICLEISAPFFPLWFTLIVCVSGVCKSIVGVAGGSTRAALTLHQARRNNMADVSAKDGSQETLVNLAALICSLMLVPIVAEQHGLVWTLFAIFTCIHLWANYSAVTSVVMETINQARLHILVKDFFVTNSPEMMSIAEANYREPVILKTKWVYDICMGSQLHLISNSSFSLGSLASLKDLYDDEKYILGVNNETKKIHIILRHDSNVADQLKAAFQAEIINVLSDLRNSGQAGQQTRVSGNVIADNAINEVLCTSIYAALGHNDAFEVSQLTLQLTRNIFPYFYSQLSSTGWTTSHVLLGADEWRSAWGKDLNLNGVN